VPGNPKFTNLLAARIANGLDQEFPNQLRYAVGKRAEFLQHGDDGGVLCARASVLHLDGEADSSIEHRNGVYTLCANLAHDVAVSGFHQQRVEAVGSTHEEWRTKHRA